MCGDTAHLLTELSKKAFSDKAVVLEAPPYIYLLHFISSAEMARPDEKLHSMYVVFESFS